MSYKTEPWFALLLQACEAHGQRQKVATMLGVSPATLSQVLNGSGKYGTGEASTANLAERVVHTFGRYECPHLTEQAGEPKVIDADTCRVYAHRPAPVGSPRDMQHWQACRTCPHKAASAPPVQREVKPRKPRAAAPEADGTAPSTPKEPPHDAL